MHALQNTVKKKGHVFWVASSQGAGVWGRGNHSWWCSSTLHHPAPIAAQQSKSYKRQRKHCHFLIHLLPSGDHFVCKFCKLYQVYLRPRGSQRVEGWAYRVPGSQRVGLQRLRGSRGRPTRSLTPDYPRTSPNHSRSPKIVLRYGSTWADTSWYLVLLGQ